MFANVASNASHFIVVSKWHRLLNILHNILLTETVSTLSKEQTPRNFPRLASGHWRQHNGPHWKRQWLHCIVYFFLALQPTLSDTSFQTNLRGRRPGAVAQLRLPVLRGERCGELRRSLAGLPVAVEGSEVGPAAEGAADPEEARCEQRLEGAGQHIREELEGRPEEEALAEYMKGVGAEEEHRESSFLRVARR